MRALIVCVTCLALLLSPGASTSAEGRGILEVEGRLIVAPTSSGTAVFEIDTIYSLQGGEWVQAAGSLEVACPTGALSARMAVIGPQDTLTLAWTVHRRPKRKVVKESKGGRASLSVPAEGWAIHCTGGDSHPLYGLFVTEEGVAREIQVVGGAGGFWSRVGLKKGKRAKAPDKVRLRLSWSPMPVQSETATPEVVSASRR